MIKKEHKTTPHEEGPARRKPSSHRGGGRRAHRRTFQKERERERFFKIALFSLSVSSFSSSLSYFGAYFLLLFRFFLVKNVCLRGPSLHQKEREREREIPSHPSHPSRLSLFKKKKKMMMSSSSSSALLVAKNEKVKATLREN